MSVCICTSIARSAGIHRRAVVLMFMLMLMYTAPHGRALSTWGLCEHLGPHLMLGLRYLPPGEHRRAVKYLHGQGSGLGCGRGVG